MIEVTFTIKQARKIMRAIHQYDDLTEIYEDLKQRISLHDYCIANKAPWRKVVRHYAEGAARYDELECGHRYQLRQSHRASCDWIEDHAKKRRCERCNL